MAGEAFGLGVTQRIDPTHRAIAGDPLGAAILDAERAAQHLWIATAVHQVSESALRTMRAEPLLLDAESLMTTQLGCFICEQPFGPELLGTACPGDPS